MRGRLFMTDNIIKEDYQKKSTTHIFIIGAKSIGQYGGYETFVDRLIGEHENDPSIKYHIACKANGNGFMDESKLEGVEVLKTDNGHVMEFMYHNAHVFKIPCPNIGPAVAIYYDRAAVKYSIQYCKRKGIEHPIFYILTCRIGMFINGLAKDVKSIGGKYYLNPDGHEFLRAKWSKPIRGYWKWSERMMVKKADVVICDSKCIEKYIKEEYHHPNTTYISYGADIRASLLSDSDPHFNKWLEEKGLKPGEYYLVVGRFVPENNFETIIKEFMKSKSKKNFAIITNMNEKLRGQLEERLHFSADERIKFVGTVYEKELLKKIRENAYGYFHGHEVGGTNPSLLEALGSTEMNLLLDVGFNREVGGDAALYWTKESGSLSRLIDSTDLMNLKERAEYGRRAKERIKSAYSWSFIGEEYRRVWTI
jgi:rhamnosyltransferase